MEIIKIIILFIGLSGLNMNNCGQQSICFPMSFTNNSEQESISPNTRYVEIDELTIINHDLNPILDNIISTEKHRDYYNSELRFYIRRFSEFDNYIHISAGRRYTADDVSGILFYKGHKILVEGIQDDVQEQSRKEQSIPIFKKTGKKIKIDFEDKKSYYDEKIGSLMSVYYEDDTFSNWRYEYVNGKFNLKMIIDTKSGTVTEY